MLSTKTTTTSAFRAGFAALVLSAGLAATEAFAAAGYRYYEFSITGTQGGGIFQLSEFAFYSSGTNPTNGTRVIPSAVAINGTYNAGEGPTNLYDSNTGTKYCDTSTAWPQWMIFDFGSPVVLTGYDWATANDTTPARNPNNWTIQACNNANTSTGDGSWITLDTETNAGQSPTSTFTWAGGWPLAYTLTLLNGSFENPVLGGNSFTYYNGLTAAQQAAFAWTSTGNGGTGGALLNNSTAWGYNMPYPNGSQCFSLQKDSTLSQTVYMLAGGNYLISWYQAQRPGYTTNPYYLQVDGVSLNHGQTFAADSNAWEHVTTGFTVTPGNHTISFVGTTAGADYDVALDNITITQAASSWPLQWVDADIGGPTYKGSATWTPGGGPYGTFNVAGGGADIWNATDQFNFCYYNVPLNGNVTITARVSNFTNPVGDGWSKVGLMVRQYVTDGNGPGSPDNYNIWSWGNQVQPQSRDRLNDGGSLLNTNIGGPNGSGGGYVWLRLSYVASTYTATSSYSTDGVNWQGTFSHTDATAWGLPVYVGLCVTTHNDTLTPVSSATFDNITITGTGVPLAPPTFSDNNNGGIPCTVTLNDTDANATIYYTTDGSIPVAGQGTTQSCSPGSAITPNPLTFSTTVNAYAHDAGSGLPDSAVASQWYGAGTVATPTLSDDNNGKPPCTITVNCNTPTATLYYTITAGMAGTTPTTSSPSMSPGGTIVLPVSDQAVTVEVMGAKPGWISSPVVSQLYIEQLAPAPVINANTLIEPSTITITDSLAQGLDNSPTRIYYTIDGSTPGGDSLGNPSGTSVLYNGSFVETTPNAVIQAVAVAYGYLPSNWNADGVTGSQPWLFVDSLRTPEYAAGTNLSGAGLVNGVFRQYYEFGANMYLPATPDIDTAWTPATGGGYIGNTIDPLAYMAGNEGWTTPSQWTTNVAPSATNANDPFSTSHTDNWGLQWTGYITVPQNGIYAFGSSSDDCAQMWIGNRQVNFNNYFQGAGSGQMNEDTNVWANNRIRFIGLAAGTHKISVQFFEGGGGYGIAACYAGPGINSGINWYSQGGNNWYIMPTTALWTEPMPTLTSMDLTGGPTTGGTLVHITGTGFVATTQVTFGGVAATNVVVSSSTKITCYSPPGAAGAAAVVVKNVNGAASTALNFTYVNWTGKLTPAPTALDLTSGPQAGGTLISITGTGFDPSATSTTVYFGYNAASYVIVSSNTLIQCKSPAGIALGAVDVTVTNNYAGFGGASGTVFSGFTYVDWTGQLIPTISSIDMTGGPLEGGTLVNITGKNFASGAKVNFGVNADTSFASGYVTVVSDTKIQCKSPAGASFGQVVDVTVTDLYSGGTSGASGTSALKFTYEDWVSLGYVIPEVDMLDVTSGTQAGGTAVTVYGVNFTSFDSVAVYFGTGKANSVVVQDDNTITCTTPASGVVGWVDVTATGIYGTEGASYTLSGAFDYTPGQPPTLAGLYVGTTLTKHGISGLSVSLHGTNFLPGATVLFGSVAATGVTWVSATRMTAVVPPMAVGPATVNVTLNTGVNPPATLTNYWTYDTPTINANGVSPNTGGSYGGTSVTISGTNFSSGLTVTFGGTAATNVVLTGSTSITCTTPAKLGYVGAVDVKVTNPGGLFATASGGFTYHGPVITGITGTCPYTGNTAIQINGSDFGVGCSVTFGGVAGLSVSVNSSGTVITVTPPAMTGLATVAVVVTNPAPDGLSGSSTLTYSGLIAADLASTAGMVPGVFRQFYEQPQGGNSLPVTTDLNTAWPPLPAYQGIDAIPEIGGNNWSNLPYSGGGDQDPFDTGRGDNWGVQWTGYINIPQSGLYWFGTDCDDGGMIYISNTTADVNYYWQGTGTGQLDDTGRVRSLGLQAGLHKITVQFFEGGGGWGIRSLIGGPLISGTPFYTNNLASWYDIPGSMLWTQPICALTSINPAGGPTGGGTLVAITGSGFAPGVTVMFGSTPATNVTVNTNSLITCTAPAGAAGTVNVTVTNLNDDAATLANAWTYVDWSANPTPTVTGVSPNTGSQAGGDSVQITGTNFVAPVEVYFGGYQAPSGSITVNSNTLITCNTPASSSVGTVNVTVYDMVGSYGSSGTLTNGFTYTLAPPPSVTGISPSSGTYAGGTAVTISGTGLLPGAIVTFGGVASPLVVFTDNQTITATTPAINPLASSNVVTVVVNNNNGTASATSPTPFTYTGLLAPDLPSTAGLMNGVFRQYYEEAAGSGSPPGPGSNILPGTPDLNSTWAPYGGSTNAIDSDMQIIYDASVNGNPYRTNQGHNDQWGVQFKAWVMIPESGAYTFGLDSDDATMLYIAGQQVVSDNYWQGWRNDGNPQQTGTIGLMAGLHQITAQFYEGGGGWGMHVYYSGPGVTGWVVLPHSALWTQAAPVVSSLDVTGGPTSGGTLVHITGQYFAAGATVTFGGVSATNVIVASNTLISCISPGGTGTANVTVTNVTTNYASGTKTGAFTYMTWPYTLPAVTAVVDEVTGAAHGDPAGGEPATLYGNFTTDPTYTTLVYFGTNLATAVVIAPDGSTITCVTPSGIGQVDVTVTQIDASGNAASGTKSNGFVFAAFPTITSVSPSHGSALGGTTMTITGTNYAISGVVVTIGSGQATNVVVTNNNTTITCTTPAMTGTDPVKDVVVTNPGALSGTAPGAYTYDLQAAVTVPAIQTGLSYEYYQLPAGAPYMTPANFAALTPYMAGWRATPYFTSNPFEPGRNDNWGGVYVGYIYFPNDGVWTIQTDADDSSNIYLDGQKLGNGPQWTTVGTIGLQGGWHQFLFTSQQFGGGMSFNAQFLNDSYNGGSMIQIPAANYAVDLMPTVSSIVPNVGPTNGGTAITISGPNAFRTPLTVDIGGVAATGVTLNANNTISASTPAGAYGPADVVVSEPGLGSMVIMKGSFIYQGAAPTITGVAPNSGPPAGGNSIIIEGTNFNPGNYYYPGPQVTIGGQACTNVAWLSPTQVTATVPGGAVGMYDVVLTNIDLQQATLHDGYTYLGASVVTEPGLQYRYWRSGNLPPFTNPGAPWAAGVEPNNSVPVPGQTTNTFDTDPAYGNNNWSLYFQGYAQVDVPGQYTVYSESDDTNQVWIDGKLITNVVGWGTASGGTTQLSAGRHAVAMTWQQGGGGWYYNPISVSMGKLVAHYALDSDTNDSTGNGHDGTAANPPTFVPGEFGNAMTFDGTSQSVSVPYSTAFSLSSFTVSAWVNPNTLSGNLGILGTRFGYDCTFDMKLSNGTVHADLGDGWNWVNTALDFPYGGNVGEWHMITYAVDYAAQNVKMYYDGILQGTIAISGTPLFMGGGQRGYQTLGIGQDYPGEFFNGAIDDVCIFAGALSAQEIQTVLAGNISAFMTASAPVTVPNDHLFCEVPPEVTSCTPDSGGLLNPITIQGAGFLPGTNVAIGGVWAVGVTYVDAQTLTAYTPSSVGSTGPVNVVVVLPDGSAGMLENGYNFTTTNRSPDLTSTNGLVNGTYYKYYAGWGNLIPSNSPDAFEGLTPTATGFTRPGVNLQINTLPMCAGPIAGNDEGFSSPDRGANNGGNLLSLITVPTLLGEDNFAYRHTAYFQVPVGGDGTYTFTTSSDDGSMLFIGDTQVVNNNYWQGTTDRSGSIGLAAGLHLITILYNEGGGGWNLSARVTGPGVNPGGSDFIPDANLWVAIPTGVPAITSISPNYGPVAGGTSITITGTGFAASDVVTIGGIAAINVIVYSNTSITCITPAAAVGTFGPKDVVVSGGFAASPGTLPGGFTYTLPATQFQVTPSVSSVVAGTPLDVTVTAMSPAVEGLSGFGGNGNGWTLNGGATALNNVLTLTDGVNGEARSAFYDNQVSTQVPFNANFLYQASGNIGADGVAFVFQNAGPTALGGGGGALGYGGIAGNSAALEINIYTGHTVGINLVANGATGTYNSTGAVAVNSGHPILFHLVYNPVAQTLLVVLTDQTTQATYSTTYTGISLYNIMASPVAYVGFTGGTGGLNAVQTISNFSFGNSATPLPDTGYAGTVHLSSGDPGPLKVLPTDYTFQPSDNGTHTFHGVVLVTCPSQTITATDASDAAISGTSPAVTVTANPVIDHLAVTGFPSPSTAGVPGSVTVTSNDLYNNYSPGYLGRVHFSSSDVAPQVVLPADYTFVPADNGVHTFLNMAALVTAGTQSITATDTVTSTITGTQSNIQVIAAAATKLLVSGYQSPVVAAAGSVFAVTAQDPYGNTATTYLGTVHFTSSDLGVGVVLPDDYTFSDTDLGVKSFLPATLVTMGLQSITATDTITGSITGTQSGIHVVPMLVVTGFPSTTTAGVPGDVTVSATDALLNPEPTYVGTIHFTSSDTAPQVMLPADYTFVAGDLGTHTFPGGVTLVTMGTQSITATDVAVPVTTGSETPITVLAAAASKLLVYGFPNPTTVGFQAGETVAAYDPYNNVADSYLGTVQLSSSDPAAVLPGDYTFVPGDAGVHTFNVTLMSAGTQSITATDTVTTSITGSQIDIVVNRATPTITWPNPADIVYGTALGDTQLNATVSVPGVLTYTPASGTVLLPGAAQTLHVDYVPNDPANYNPTSKDVSINVTLKALTVSGFGAANKIYDGTTVATPTGTGTLVGVVGTDDVSLSGSPVGAFVDKNVGTAKPVTISGLSLIGAQAMYYTLTPPTATADITPAALTVSATGINKVYDQTPAATVTLSDDRVAGDDLTTNYAAAAFADASAGLAKAVSVTGITVTGTDAGNYTYNDTASTTADITPLALTVTGITANSKPYDGDTTAVLVGAPGLLVGVIAPDDVSLTGTAVGTFADKNVGTAKTVTITGLSLTGLQAGDYICAEVTTTADITAIGLTVFAAGVNKVYDGTTAATVNLTDDRIANDTLTYSYTAAFADKNVGTAKAVSVTGIAVTGLDAGNYILNNTTADTTADITQAALTVSATGINKVYDQTPAATVTLSDNRAAGDDLTTSYAAAAFADKNVGTAKAVSVTGIAVTGADMDNYTLTNTTANTTADITPAALTVSATGINKMYDGTTAATVTLSDDRIAGDVFTDSYASAAFDTPDVGTGKTVTVTGIAITGTDAGNYICNTTAVTTADITAPTIQITACETQDANGNGFIDAIRIVTNGLLTDNFSGLQITVAGYTVVGYDTGGTVNDNEFFVRLAEGTTPDTDATPDVQVLNGGNLYLPVEDFGPATDKAKPVLMTAQWFDGSGAGVDANDPVYLTFSEPVTSNNALAGDFGLPVAGDTFGVGATVSNGQNGTNPNIITITLMGDPLLTPGGLYGPGALTAGSPTGIFVADGTRIVDANGNTALVQTVGTAVDLQPGTENISICWEDLTVAPKTWNLGIVALATTSQAFGAFPPDGLVARNNGNVREKFTASVSTAVPAGWAVAPSAGQDQFEMKVDNGVAPYGNYTLDLATGPKDIVGQMYSGHNKGFDLQLKMPTSISTGAGVAQTVTVTITATKD